MESEIIDEEARLQWKKGNLELERTGLNYLQATSSAVQEKQISSYTSYEQSTSKFATSTKKKSTRKRKSRKLTSYAESSEEEDHSSDPDYMEKPKRKQELRKRSRRKASDGMDKDVVVPFVETSEAPEDTTSHEITPGISESLTPSEISEDIATSREDTPCPVIQSTQRTPLDTISTLRDTPRSVIQSTQQATIFTPQ